MKASIRSSAIRVGPCFTSTTSSGGRAIESRTTSSGTSKARCTWRTVTRARRAIGAVTWGQVRAGAGGGAGVVLVTSGPGATNAVTGIANAYMDSTPIVVITGQVPKHLIGTDAFQEVDTVGITRPCVKHNYLVREASDLPAIVREAFHL